MVSKKGAIHYEIIISLILGLIVVGLSMYFIFIEYFNEDELDWQQCRQSILLRSNLPNLKELGTDLKGAFPLKCKTEVVTIDSAEPEEVYGKISEAIAEGWYMFGEGELDFIHSEFLEKDNYCLAFARVHYTSDAIEESEKLKFEGDVLGFSNYYHGTNVPGKSYTYDEYLPMVFLEEDLSHALIPLTLQIYPQEEDLILVYATSRKQTGFVGDISEDWINVARWRDFIVGWVSRDREKRESAELGLLEALRIDRAILLTTSENLEGLGCKFLSIPA